MREKDQHSTAREKESWGCRSTRAKVTGSNPLWAGKFEAEGLWLGGEARGWWVVVTGRRRLQVLLTVA